MQCHNNDRLNHEGIPTVIIVTVIMQYLLEDVGTPCLSACFQLPMYVRMFVHMLSHTYIVQWNLANPTPLQSNILSNPTII